MEILQKTKDWYVSRLGNFTGSEISELMVSGRKKEEMFGKTALAYINKKKAERMISVDTIEDEDKWMRFCHLYYVTNKYMDYGTENEEVARMLYTEVTGNEVEMVGSMPSSVPFFSASPDGIVQELDKKGVLEIKCPKIEAAMLYIDNVHDSESLKLVKPEYYWQTQAEMLVAGADFCDFVVYCEFFDKQLHVVRLLPCIEDQEAIIQRVVEANKIIGINEIRYK